MKKYFYFLSAVVVAFAATTCVNVYFATIGTQSLTIAQLDNVEAYAGDPEWNHWVHWLPYGLTQDEREEKRDCPVWNSWWGCVMWYASGKGFEASGEVSGGSSKVNTSGRYEFICAHGNTNCTSVGC